MWTDGDQMGRERQGRKASLERRGKPALAQRVLCARQEVASKYFNSAHLIRPSYFHPLVQSDACAGVIFEPWWRSGSSDMASCPSLRLCDAAVSLPESPIIEWHVLNTLKFTQD